jgi:hypothetical protein
MKGAELWVGWTLPAHPKPLFLPFLDVRRERIEQAARSRMRQYDRALREMLGEWVSELEPALVWDQFGRLIGLTFAGIPPGIDAPICVKAPSWLLLGARLALDEAPRAGRDPHSSAR